LISPYAIIMNIASTGNPSGYSGIDAGLTVTVIVTDAVGSCCIKSELGPIPPDEPNWIGEIVRKLGWMIVGPLKVA
jgi:hypothetical protein